MTLAHILTDEQARILVEERRALAELRLALERVAMEDDDAASFDASLRQLDELFLLVVAGEFNAGKSAFINALMGERLLERERAPGHTSEHRLGAEYPVHRVIFRCCRRCPP